MVLEFRGPLVDRARLLDFTHTMEIAPGLFLGSSGGPDDFVNHSCEPNCVVRIDSGRAFLEALRDIRRGDELTYDYSTSMLTDPTRFDCACGAASCRGTVTRWGELPAEVRSRQLEQGIVPAFVAGTRRAGSTPG